ncbi:MAG: cation transporter [Gammaproteobacteria bacterium]|nr:cation transporter [Gammaproteobacteria bacterium]
MENITIKISGMTCGGCVNSVTNVLQQLAGVNSVDVSLEPGEAKIAYDASAIGPDELKSAIEGAGYDVA